MAIGITTGQVHDYVLERERGLPPEQQTVFQLRTLTTRQRFRLMDLHRLRDGGVEIRQGEVQYTALKVGLVGWRNFLDANGAEIPFEREGGIRSVNHIDVNGPASDATLDRLASEDALELAEAVASAAHLTRADAKN